MAHFVFDECLARQLPKLVSVFDRTGHLIDDVRDLFGEGTKDEVWLQDLGGRVPPPIVISGDGRILRNRAQRAILRTLPLTFVVLAPSWTSLRWEDQAPRFLTAWPSIVAATMGARQPTVFEVAISGKKIDRVDFTKDL